MNGAQILIKALEAEGVDTVFGYPGGAIMPVYDALVGTSLKHILVRHEQAAALAADGYARASGKVGVCLATSGPGATNLITGIANAHLDSVPMVAITGQVSSTLMGTDAFQEVDIFGISMPIVKHNFIIRQTSEIASTIHAAFELARSGRPGPVLVDLPKDVMSALHEETTFAGGGMQHLPRPEARQLHIARDLIMDSAQPLIYAGGGVRIAQASKELRAFAEATGIPVVTTLQGLGAIPGHHPLNLGMLGMHGSKAANFAVQQCDLLICIGARFDDRVTGKLAEFAPNARVIHLDADPAEIGKLRQVACAIMGDIKVGLNFLHVRPEIDFWVKRCMVNKEKFAWDYDAPTETVYAPKFIKEMSYRSPDNTFIACDVGQHQMWVAQHYKFDSPNNHLTSGGLGTMGYGIPAAMGAQLAHPEATVVAVSGDGSILMNIQELATLKRYNIPIKIVLFDNKALGMVRQWQELFFAENYSEVDLSDNPDFVKVAEAFGIPAFRVERQDQVSEALEKMFNHQGPVLVHVLIDPKENVWPLVPPGKSNENMMEAKLKAV
ncbi:MAG: acetolactate synthase 2 catalytic subunit [Cyanobacteria bacterium SZAS LIN-2]|nr:acetolactate synthase 2 catalytic subunit [Cyanobacteria bacterium SZAS LIN-2]MBS2010169.1 acetolactate synthase 2 catalytic subunit [Cyanobacteria bacterium SZAS TMP-1]